MAAQPEPPEAAAATLREEALRWDGYMDAASTGAAAYASVRRTLTSILADRSGLSVVSDKPFAAVPPGVAVHGELWWTLPTLLRNDDTAMPGGRDWTRAFQQALSQASAAKPRPWGEPTGRA